MGKYAVAATTSFFIVNFIVLLDEMFVGEILPNFSLSVFLIELVYLIGSLFNSVLNIFTGLIRLELRVTGFLLIITKAFLWIGGTFTTILGDILALPFTLIYGITGVGRVDVLNICNINVIGGCKPEHYYAGGSLSSLDVGTQAGTNYVKNVFFLAMDFRYGSFEVGYYFQSYNYVDTNLIFNDKAFLGMGFSLAGNGSYTSRLIGERYINSFTVRFDGRLIIGINETLEILDGLNSAFTSASDNIGTWEDLFYKTIGDDF